MTLRGFNHVTSGTPYDFRWPFPKFFQKSKLVYSGARSYRHRDYAGRVSELIPAEDCYLHHVDGYLRKLIVQCTDEIFAGEGKSTWHRTYVRKMSPTKVRLATWIMDYNYDPDSWQDYFVLVLRTIPVGVAMLFVVCLGR